VIFFPGGSHSSISLIFLRYIRQITVYLRSDNQMKNTEENKQMQKKIKLIQKLNAWNNVVGN
jgi:hypothetical protein